MTDAPSPTIWSELSSPTRAENFWLTRHPSEIDSCVRDRAKHPIQPLDAAALEELRNAHARWGADALSLAAIERLADPRARVVVTGQQPGLLGGTLLNVYKTLEAIRLARTLQERFPELHIVPVFWVASEDDDFDEVKRAHWPNTLGGLQEFFLDRGDEKLGWREGRMIGTLPASAFAESLRKRIEDSTRETEFSKEALDFIFSPKNASETWEDAFCRILLRLVQGQGLVIVSPLMRWVRQRGAPILLKELSLRGKSSRDVIARGEELRRNGIEPKLHRRDDALNLFRIDDAQCRWASRIEGDSVNWIPPEASREAFPPTLIEQLAGEIAASPERFSFNVVTRPMVQDSIFPTVAQVVGPGEAAYLAQVESVYDAFGVFAPVRQPRPQATLVTPAAAKGLEKYGLSARQAMEFDSTALARKVIERDAGEGFTAEVAQLKERHRAELRSLATATGNNTALASAFEKLDHAMEKGYETIRERALYARQADERQLNEAMMKLETIFRPSGQPQERILNPVVPFVLQYGWDWALRAALLLKYDDPEGTTVILLSTLPTGTNQNNSKS